MLSVYVFIYVCAFFPCNRYRGVREGTVAENTSYYIFTQCADGAFEAFPVQEWYSFSPVIRYKYLNSEEAEDEFSRYRKPGAFSLFVFFIFFFFFIFFSFSSLVELWGSPFWLAFCVSSYCTFQLWSVVLVEEGYEKMQVNGLLGQKEWKQGTVKGGKNRKKWAGKRNLKISMQEMNPFTRPSSSSRPSNIASRGSSTHSTKLIPTTS